MHMAILQGPGFERSGELYWLATVITTFCANDLLPFILAMALTFFSTVRRFQEPALSLVSALCNSTAPPCGRVTATHMADFSFKLHLRRYLG